MKTALLLAAVAAGVSFVSAAQAQSTPRERLASGAKAGLTWQARNMVVGVTSTNLVSAGGDPIYFANRPEYDGVVTLIQQYSNGDAFICTGTLASRNSIVTAAHCVSDGYGKGGTPEKVTAYFSNNRDPDFVRFARDGTFEAAPGAVAIDVTHMHINPGYTGEVIDQNDIAVLKLATDAPDFATIYKLYTPDTLQGDILNLVGNGRRSSEGGDLGYDLGTGVMRQGYNQYDYAWGDSSFDGFFTDGFFGTADVQYSYISDFDNGLLDNDTACLIAYVVSGSTNFCGTSLGAYEANLGGGDSGGPAFVNGKLASVNSYGLSFGSDFGDLDDSLNGTFGEFSGYVPIYIHQTWLSGVVPEPATWAMMITGFGLVGGAMRRRRTAMAH